MNLPPQPITIDGVSRTAGQWAKISGLTKTTIHRRIRSGWDARRAVFEDARLGNVTVRKARRQLPPPVAKGISTFPMGAIRSFPLYALDILRRVA